MVKAALDCADFFHPGDLFARRYQVERLLGKGAFGQVFRAWDHRQQRHVALKASQRGTLETEAALLRLVSPVISAPQAFDVGWSQGFYYLVMQYIEGVTLRDLLCVYQAAGRQISMQEVLGLAIQLCSALETLHERRYPLIVCDLKPENILLSAQGKLFLIDFGIACLAPEGMREEAQRLGTPPYVAPEYLAEGRIHPGTDIYALGMILLELLRHDHGSGLRGLLEPFLLLRFGPVGRLIRQMLHPQEQKRASARALKQAFEHLLTDCFQAGALPLALQQVGCKKSLEIAALRRKKRSRKPDNLAENCEW